MLFAGACRSRAEREREAEIARLAHAIDALRNAPNVAKAPLIASLERVSCQRAEVCKLKQDCVAAYRHLVNSVEASAHARELLSERDGGLGAELTAANELNRGEAELHLAGELTELCASRQGELTRSARAR